MPNNIANKLYIDGTKEQVESVFRFIKSEESDFDFNNIIPMPISLDIENSSDVDRGMEYLLYKADNITFSQFKESFEIVNTYEGKRKRDCIVLGQKSLANIGLHGYANWYEWRRAKWGTKWNAYDVEKEGDCIITFNTAWNGVPDIIVKLSEFFPEVNFEYMFADEDTGYNTGSGTIKNGVADMEYPEGRSNEAFAIYFATHPYNREYYEFKNGKWTYKEEELEEEL